jgi:hypothetical protein
MDAVERLVLAGMGRECAVETVIWFTRQGSEEKMEDYISDVERKMALLREAGHDVRI